MLLNFYGAVLCELLIIVMLLFRYSERCSVLVKIVVDVGFGVVVCWWKHSYIGK